MSPASLRNFALFASLCVFAPVTPALADVTPALLFQNFAVLQQGRAVPVWGTADAGEKITVTYTAGSVTRTASATAGADGRWRAELPALSASATPATLTFAGKNTVTRSDILVGEVWLASGQSNMEWALGWGDRVANARAEIAAADFPLIREIKINVSASDTPLTTSPGKWRACSPSTASNFSATAYFFARDLHQSLNVPVGIIAAAWGGSMIEPFMTPASLATDPHGPAVLERWKEKTADYPARKARYDEELAAYNAAKTAARAGENFPQKRPSLPPGPGHQATPSGSYNAMIHPLVPYAIRGVIWYQGESNAGRHVEYRTFFPSLIAGWREVFQQPDLPFYWVQLASWGANGDPDGVGFAWLRDAQDRTLSVPHTGQALALDIGDTDNIHPANKQDVGHRLARLALHRTYDRTDIIDSGPTFAGIELDAGFPHLIRVRFENLAAGLKNTNPAHPAAVLGFEVAGADKQFRPAAARIENSTTGIVVLTAPATVPAPAFVRYAFRNDPKNTLANSEGLPAAPFRTDP